MFPPAPPLGSLRLASIADVPRLAVVATAGYCYSPMFAWERPKHHRFPLDTFKSYEKMLADPIRDPDSIVLVAEAGYLPYEHQKTGAIIKPDVELPVLLPNQTVVVGVAAFKLEPTSCRRGQFMDPNDTDPCSPSFEPGEERDKNKRHIEILDAKCDAARERYLTNHSRLDLLVVHPAYWRRGFGSSLVRWGMALADIDAVRQGVEACGMGERLLAKLNYTRIRKVVAEDNDEQTKVGIWRYEPQILSKQDFIRAEL
ncbi:MAG: hypothetical protein MMC23_006037 [Stictis urceolatum]|nr:hypothetical protein [Stictis urceolata]